MREMITSSTLYFFVGANLNCSALIYNKILLYSSAMDYDLSKSGRSPGNSRSSKKSDKEPEPKPATDIKKKYGGNSDAPTKVYSDADITEMLSKGYIRVDPKYYDVIPIGAHVRYVRKGNSPRGERFKPGGFVKSKHTDDSGRTIMYLSNSLNGKKGDKGYIEFPICLQDIEELWKKYDYHAYIEITLLHKSLQQKTVQIEELTKRIATIETVLKQAIHYK